MGTGSGKTVLVVEDDAPTAAFLTDNLRADGYRVLCSGRAADALRLVEAARPDLLLLDLGLEAGTGFDVLDRVRGAGGGSRIDPEVPVIVLTGRSSELDRVRGFARGADDYVCKPFSYPELVGADFNSVVSTRGARRRGSQAESFGPSTLLSTARTRPAAVARAPPAGEGRERPGALAAGPADGLPRDRRR